MPRRLSLSVIRARIAELEAKAKKLQDAAKPGLKQVIALIKKHRLTPSDVSKAFSPVTYSKPSKLQGKKAPIKYRDKQGNTWAGRGLAPKWLVAAEKAGRKREEFLVKRG